MREDARVLKRSAIFACCYRSRLCGCCGSCGSGYAVAAAIFAISRRERVFYVRATLKSSGASGESERRWRR